MVIVGHHSTPLWALVGAAVFVLCQAKPQNYAFRFNQQPLTGVLAPNGQSQYPTLVTPLVEGCIDILSSGFAFTGSVTMVQDNGCNIIIDTPTATDVGSKTKMLSGASFIYAHT
uniref:Uncharacterized protein n=1 Tax=Plectus sambesii TaxID=2011161 RepID=A0A914XDG0_9BILA